jgi:titin
VRIQAEEWSREGSRLLVTIARKSTAVRTPEEATVLLTEIDRFLKQGELKQDERIAKIKNMASHLYGERIIS